MNKVYKLVWSKVRNCWVAVAEIAKSHSKTSNNNIIDKRVLGNKIHLQLQNGYYSSVLDDSNICFVPNAFVVNSAINERPISTDFKITVAAIVKNEAKNVPQWVQAAKSCADEIVVVDTGSTDGTVERFADYGIKCFHYKWNDDFASAKNYMISLCHGDWIVLLDGDEWFREGCDVRKAIAKHHNNPIEKAIIADWICLDSSRNNMIMFSGGAVRAFRNHPSIRYFRKVHENLTLRYENFVFEPEFKMYHTGYSGDVNRSKHERNLRIMRTMFDFDNGKVEYPTDWRYVQDTYAGLGNYEKSMEASDKMIAYGVQEYSAASWITRFNVLFAMKADVKRMDKEFEYCFKTTPSVSGFRFLAAIYYLKNGIVNKGLDNYIEGLRMLMGPQDKVALEHTYWRMYLPEASMLASTVYLQNKQAEAALYACKVSEQYCGKTVWTDNILADIHKALHNNKNVVSDFCFDKILPVLGFSKKAVLASALASSFIVGLAGIYNPVYAACCNLNGVASNCASGTDATVTGGACNIASSNGTSVSGGVCNIAGCWGYYFNGGKIYYISPSDADSNATITDGQFASVSGGCFNLALGNATSILGGQRNGALGEYSTISGGQCNVAMGCYSNILGGVYNTTKGDYSIIIGGCCNVTDHYYKYYDNNDEVHYVPITCNKVVNGNYQVNNYVSYPVTESFGKYSIAIGGECNSSDGYSAVTVGGQNNLTFGYDVVAVGGECNIVDGSNDVIISGSNNISFGSDSAIISGQGNINYGLNSAIYGGHCNKIDGQTYYGSILGGCGNHIYTNSDTGNFTTGAVIVGGSNSTIYEYGEHSAILGGNSNIACCAYSAVVGGASNRVEGDYGTILGGAFNVTGDKNFYAEGFYSTVSGGEHNVAKGAYTSIFGGCCNIVSGCDTVIFGGTKNRAGDAYSYVDNNGKINFVQGFCDAINYNGEIGTYGEPGYYSGTVIDVGNNTYPVKEYSAYAAVAVGGTDNKSFGNYSVVSGGKCNFVSACYATITGGLCNKIAAGEYFSYEDLDDAVRYIPSNADGINVDEGTYTDNQGIDYYYTYLCSDYASISGGKCNLAVGDYSSISAGNNNKALSHYSSITGGQCNQTEGAYATVSGGQCNIARGTASVVAGGENSRAYADKSVAIGGGITGQDFDSTTATGSVAIGKDATTTRNYEVAIGSVCSPVKLGGNMNVTGTNTVTDGTNTKTWTELLTNSGSNGSSSADIHLYAGIGGTCNAVTTNGNTKLVLADDTTVIDTLSINGTGSTKVTSDANGTITIGACFADGIVLAGGNNTSSGCYSSVSAGCNNIANACYATVNGGACNLAGRWGYYFEGNPAVLKYITPETTSVYGNAVTASVGEYASVNGGACNYALGNYSSILGGQNNGAIGDYSTIGSGQCNTALAQYSNVTGGYCNTANAECSVIVGGCCNITEHYYYYYDNNNVVHTVPASCATIIGHCIQVDNKTYYAFSSTGRNSVSIGGKCNKTAGNSSVTIAGGCNINVGYNSTIIGGLYNVANGTEDVIIGGSSNSTNYSGSVIVAGQCNVINASDSTIISGECNLIDHQVYYSSILGGGRNRIGFAEGQGYDPDWAVIAGGFNNGINSFGDYASIFGGTTNNANAMYTTAVGGGHNSAESEGGVVVGGYGNTLGDYEHSANDGFYSVLVGGECNLVKGEYTSLFGGKCNIVSGCYATAVGGVCNKVGSVYSYVDGSGNTVYIQGTCDDIYEGSVDDYYGLVIDIDGNTYPAKEHQAEGAATFGGNNNRVFGNYSVILGGNCNFINDEYATIIGGTCNVIEEYTYCYYTDLDGVTRYIPANTSGIDFDAWTYTDGDGIVYDVMFTSGYHSSIISGKCNTALGVYSVITGGVNNTIFGDYSLVTGGCNNQTKGDYSIIIGGQCNITRGNASVIVGGENNQAYANNSVAIGGGITGDELNATTAHHSVAIGQGATTTQNYEVSIGSACAPVKLGGNMSVTGTNTVSDGTNTKTWTELLTANGGGGSSADIHLYAGTGSTANAVSTDGNTKVVLADGTTVVDTLSIKGAGSTKVTSDANGAITIGACFADGIVLAGCSNTSSGCYSSVSAGCNNVANACYSTVSGGVCNTAGRWGYYFEGNPATIKYVNPSTTSVDGYPVTATVGEFASVNGGCFNFALGNASSILGGQRNGAIGDYSTVSGGQCNIALDSYSSVAGGTCNTVDAEHGIAVGGKCNVVGHYYRYSDSEGFHYVPITCNKVYDGYYHVNSYTQYPVTEMTGKYGVTVGGQCNMVASISASNFGGICNLAVGFYSTTVGGNGSKATGNSDVILGGGGNYSNGSNATITGGSCNRIYGNYSTITGGCDNFIDNNVYRGSIVGGNNNEIIADSRLVDSPSIFGGGNNSIYDFGNYATILGGNGNIAYCEYSVVVGGGLNSSAGDSGTVVGGTCNKVGDENLSAEGFYSVVVGGECNLAKGESTALLGGYSNTVSGCWATVVGGSFNMAGKVNTYVNDNGKTVYIQGMCENIYYDNIDDYYGMILHIGNKKYVVKEYIGEEAVAVGGSSNKSFGENSAVFGGVGNFTNTCYSTITGGYNNKIADDAYYYYYDLDGVRKYIPANTPNLDLNNDIYTDNEGIDYDVYHMSGYYASISAGACNIATGNYSSITGGVCNMATGDYSVISGGCCNIADGNLSVVVGGLCNNAVGLSTTILGGCYSRAYANYSTVIGGGIAGSATCADTAYGSVAIGRDATTTENYEVAIGSQNAPVSVGGNMSVVGTNTVTDGTTTKSWSEILVGSNSGGSANISYVGINVATGGANEDGSGATGTDAMAIGKGAVASGVQSISLGTCNTVAGCNSGTFGSSTTNSGNNSYTVGDNNTVAQNSSDVFVLGNNTSTNVSNVVVLGKDSAGEEAGTVSLGKSGYTTTVHNDQTGEDEEVQVAEVTRKITHLADGVADTDAANMKQVNAVNSRIGSITENGNYIQTGNTVYQNLSILDSNIKSINNAMEDVVTYDNSNHSLVTLSGSNGTKLTNLKAATLSEDSTDAVIGAQLYATNQNIVGFATDITRNKNNIAALNTSVTAALGSVSSTSTLVTTLNDLKADASLNNLTAAGRNVITTAAINAVQEYMASQNGSTEPATPSAPMMYSGNTNTLTVTNAGNGSLFVGEGSNVNGSQSIAIGVGNQVNANNAGAFGDPSVINADESYVLGNDDTINTGAVGSFVVGNDSISSAKGGLTFGSNNNLSDTAENSIALGNNVNVTGNNSVALGSNSIATEDNIISVGSDTLKRRITNMADGNISKNSTDAVTGSQLFVTNEKVKANEDAIATKANIDASNINVEDWATKLGTGVVEDGNTGLVNGGTVYNAIQKVQTNQFIQQNGDILSIGSSVGGNSISVANNAGKGRVITDVITDPNNASSVANVGYVQSVSETLVNSINNNLAQMDTKVNKVGANVAAMASLTPASFEGDEKWSLSAGVGNYKGETAGAIGAFYRPAENVLMNVRGSFGNNENMIGAAVSVSLSKGDIPGVTKRQMAATINKQATAINTLQQNQQAILQAREQDQKRIAELEAMVLKMAEQMNVNK